MATFSIRATEQEDKLIRSFAEVHGISLNDLFKESVLERIEDELDITAYNQALLEFEKEPTTFTHEEVLKELNFNNDV